MINVVSRRPTPGARPEGYSKKKKKKKKKKGTDVQLEISTTIPLDSKTTDEPNLQPIFKPYCLFYSPINKLEHKFKQFLATDP